tara:strand:+ start:10447 stop:10623 length:177 start_codon:yes stop_codon:yes gene_type:complete
MFIKFSDKTKKIIVKDSKDNNEIHTDSNHLSEDEDTDRRVKILKQYKDKDKNISDKSE